MHNGISFSPLPASLFETHFAISVLCIDADDLECNYSAYCKTAKECILLKISKHWAYQISGMGHDKTIPENVRTEIVVPWVQEAKFCFCDGSPASTNSREWPWWESNHKEELCLHYYTIYTICRRMYMHVGPCGLMHCSLIIISGLMYASLKSY